MASYVLAGVVGRGLHMLTVSLPYHDMRPFTPVEHGLLHSPKNLLLLYYDYEAVFYAGSTVYQVRPMGYPDERSLVEPG